MNLTASIPRLGMLAIIRNRRGIITQLEEFDGSNGRLHLVSIDYKDDASPAFEKLIWELEPSSCLLEPNSLPLPTDPPMQPDEFDAVVRSSRWSAITPFLNPHDSGPLDRLPASAPFYSAVDIENYQLIPLLKALRMPRVNLFIADDVGLGKTIEAGLILSELLIRRRVNRILILTPASLRIQWRDEMWSKFSLNFDVIDRDTTLQLRRSLGIDANPWRCCTRIIASYHYLRQPDVLEQFLNTCRTPEGSPHLPWDLIIVDEVHNLMPAALGEDSQLCRMLRQISPQFEHRLFLTATPHNGHTTSFTGLLELLDPVRFSKKNELSVIERERVKQVVIRRLKREINERTNPPRFSARKPPEAILLDFSEEEQLLMMAFEYFRSKVRSAISSSLKKKRLAGAFAIEILGKRMLSGPVTFLESWRRCKLGIEDIEAATDNDLTAAGKNVAEETSDDREAEERGATAAVVIGSWMKPILESITAEIMQIDYAAENLGISLNESIIDQNPKSDARYEALCKIIDDLLFQNENWRDDERLVVFTEYKTTLDYLLRRLRHDFSGQEERFLYLYGGMDDIEREQVKKEFNDPRAKVRVLLATDAAAEGLNLQNTARYLLHYDCPWNPSRLEQRNGRLDRHGQARDVYVYHFASREESDLKFISYLISKIDQIREDLGATGELFDEATHRRLIRGDNEEEVKLALENQIHKARASTVVNADNSISEHPEKGEDNIENQIKALSDELDFDSLSCHQTLDTALSIGASKPQLSKFDELDRFSLLNPNLSGWKEIIDESVRKQSLAGSLGPIPNLTFSSKPFIVEIEGRRVFQPRLDTMMLHLGHPLIQRSTNTLIRRRFPGPGSVSRWTIRYGEIPEGADAVFILYLEELGVNALRETFHHWIRTLIYPVVNKNLGHPLKHMPAIELRNAHSCTDPAAINYAKFLLGEFEPELKKNISRLRKELTKKLTEQMLEDGEKARKEEERRYQSRQAEVSTLITENTMTKLEREIEKLKSQRLQGVFFETDSYYEEIDRSIEAKKEELERRRIHYEEVREQLSKERERITKYLLPKRYSLQGEAQIFPIAVEIRLKSPTGSVNE